MISESIKQLVQYGLDTGLVSKEDTIYVTNRILEVLKETTYEEPESVPPVDLETILGRLTDYAVSKGLLEHDSVVYRDLFDTQLMGCLTPPPSQVTAQFRALYQESPEKATDYFYKFSQDTNYIRRYRISKDIRWKYSSPYGELDITINLSNRRKIQRPSPLPAW